MKNNIRALPAIQLIDVCKSYGFAENKVDALKNVNLEIKKGEFLALCGPSGSGKSSLLNVLSGIDQPDAGITLFLNKSLNELHENQLSAVRSRHLGFIFQFFNLIPVLSAFDNVYYPLILNGHFPRKTAQELAWHYLDSVGIRALGDRKPGQLSGGQQQRVAIARALANQPDVVVADEPTGNLDMATGDAILDLLLRINQDTGTTFIISTHSTQLKDRARRVIEIEDGELVSDSIR
ncbi:ABC transporter ATP-binding protein [Pantoea phytobeneficialis]|uniref:ABC transporter ATP-binding protein n=1 Tax=Pantoea phytobeneficialis TaxID=2052056 RepID=A0AAP9KP65_9GAMM|nr:ABC transporter ATP-binding protein [Pantoea phytobeneficialis]MDO6406135.1 ABC transporter ATP-binding protein [Pantoea phytobeneficialis]QGR06553.1 lipoprotein-releasing system ATP-binding protein LolD [Pantoea phytobeneficialis]